MFDPFNDFEARGYLRNIEGEKNPDIVKRLEHDLFAANLSDAMVFLASKPFIEYVDFLCVHKILFGEFCPWAGQDRLQTTPNKAISKADTFFCHPKDSQRAVEQGLKLAQDGVTLKKSPGVVMGLFAYAHPFLDGNGRTMLVVHTVLCHRAGFSIHWARTGKSDYLSALGEEIETPDKGILDAYLKDFIAPPLDPAGWEVAIQAIRGLDGIASSDIIEGEFSDPAISKKYEQFDQRRGYEIK
ncbi:Fic/DOC family protein [Pseudomonas syringae]|uniref:protein adenylyltransferase n=3 Tax=Pseudomonas syringae TaxID=317 RepID=A0A656K4P2_PSESF|nr:Fic family protein [Pseudomonas syringae]EPN69809.1 filamentation induced by cAMP protein Fic [Pseudomonas syringae pv. actinidiae ICMP 19096]EPM43628.1 filamentation induced by cAMP protein Fic [Pseudomonas syringae pv. actinidiae ICMP 19098]EPM70327.1 filamentation induced by cAMP protein Fic [Pseudomonas syringae pv. actinidiae ICMP 18804]EPN14667.1 filamentation induced by cAMP protein Fic [Pseudomonas syringae pv. actinidiae ICMP 19100]EPN23201.1 filamentation induced by cAMP protein F